MNALLAVAYLEGRTAGMAWGGGGVGVECLVTFFRMLSDLFCLLFYFKIIALLKVFYNSAKLHNLI